MSVLFSFLRNLNDRVPITLGRHFLVRKQESLNKKTISTTLVVSHIQ